MEGGWVDEWDSLIYPRAGGISEERASLCLPLLLACFSVAALQRFCVLFFCGFFSLFNQVIDKLTGNRSFFLKTTSASQSQKNKGQANRSSEGQTMSPWTPLTADYWTVGDAGWPWFKDVNSQTLVVALEIYSHWWGVTEDQDVARQGWRSAPGSSLTCGFRRRFGLFCSSGFKVTLQECVLTVITTLGCAAPVNRVRIYFIFADEPKSSFSLLKTIVGWSNSASLVWHKADFLIPHWQQRSQSHDLWSRTSKYKGCDIMNFNYREKGTKQPASYLH